MRRRFTRGFDQHQFSNPRKKTIFQNPIRTGLTYIVGEPHKIHESRYRRLVRQKTKMKGVPLGTELIRPFIPAKDFERSKRFYEALGFEKVLDGDVAIFKAGSGGFILQRWLDEKMPENLMMQLMVDDLSLWWAHIENLKLAHEFGVPAPRPPAMQPWGLRVAYFVDPSGVLWHVAERRAGATQD